MKDGRSTARSASRAVAPRRPPLSGSCGGGGFAPGGGEAGICGGKNWSDEMGYIGGWTRCRCWMGRWRLAGSLRVLDRAFIEAGLGLQGGVSKRN
jgi:hypothetical protein